MHMLTPKQIRLRAVVLGQEGVVFVQCDKAHVFTKGFPITREVYKLAVAYV